MASKKPSAPHSTEARDYKNAWDAYNKKAAAGEKNLIPPRRDLRSIL